jgi:nucleoid-associated protein YgaU
MSDHLSDPPPYEPPPEEEGLYEWETEEEGAGPNILWGRVIAIVLGLVLVFFAGRLTAGGGGEVDDTQLDSLRQRNAELQDNVAELEAELDAAQATPTTSPTESPGGEGDTGEAATESYEVKAGDTFQGIAESQYGDIGLAECLAEANGLTLQSTILPGDVLEVPAEESCS